MRKVDESISLDPLGVLVDLSCAQPPSLPLLEAPEGRDTSAIAITSAETSSRRRLPPLAHPASRNGDQEVRNYMVAP
jgi:hypothetical protein